jgi:hypothetical protein
MWDTFAAACRSPSLRLPCGTIFWTIVFQLTVCSCTYLRGVAALGHWNRFSSFYRYYPTAGYFGLLSLRVTYCIGLFLICISTFWVKAPQSVYSVVLSRLSLIGSGTNQSLPWDKILWGARFADYCLLSGVTRRSFNTFLRGIDECVYPGPCDC